MTFESGIRIGKYIVGRKLGQGGFGILYTARDTELDREIAIKFLRPEHAFRPSVVQRFLQEARAAARISHPGIVTVYESGIVGGTDTRADGTVYIAMELLSGETLAQRLKALGKMQVPRAIGIARQLADALAAAHASAIVHRDLKPQNIFLVPDAAVVGGERVKVLDFGIAKLVDDFGSNVQTHSMLMLGTPMYMSPEQCKSSAKVDARSDIYALGCMMFELVCGRAPFDGDSGELIAKHQLVPPPTPRSIVASLPMPLEALIMRMLAKSADDRPQTMDAVLDALHVFGDETGEPPTIPGDTVPHRPAPPATEGSTTLSESAASRPSPKRGSRRALLLGAFAAIAVGVTVGAIAVRGGGDEPVAASAAPVEATTTPTPTPTPAPAPMIAEEPARRTGELKVECLGYQSDKKWQDLANCAMKLRASDPDYAGALLKKAKSEQANELASAKVDEAIKDGDLAKARKLLDKIDDESVYKKATQTRVDGLESQVIEDWRDRAAAAKAGGKCAEVDRMINQTRALGQGVVDAVSASKCDVVSHGTASPAHHAGNTEAAVAPPPAACDAEALDEAARQDEAIGQHGSGLKKMEKAIACKPTEHRYQVAFMAACNAGDRVKAKRYYKLAGASSGTLAQMCIRNGISAADLESP
jgi:serine/threonine protein kinase